MEYSGYRLPSADFPIDRIALAHTTPAQFYTYSSSLRTPHS